MRLNLGAGNVFLPDYLNLDIKTGGQAYPLVYADDTFEVVRASHLIEHFPRYDTEAVLREWVRVLKPGGCLMVAVPDFQSLALALVNFGDYSTQERANESLEAEAVICGGQLDEHDFHKAVFTEKKLTALLKAVGLEDIRRWTSEVDDCAARPYSLNLMGRKPEAVKVEAPPEQKKIQIAAVMSVPRVGYLDTMASVLESLVQCRAPLFQAHGVYWHAALSRGIERALAWDGHADYVLTVDYDSLFNFEDVAKLVVLMHNNPEVDIIVPLQMKRHAGELLAGTEGPVNITHPLVPIKQGHFGLTLFRRSVFERLRKPWFEEKPDPQGGWNEGRVDADIAFWANAEASGVRAFLATKVMCGHGEEVVSWPRWDGEKFVAHYQSAGEWHETRRPPNLWT